MNSEWLRRHQASQDGRPKRRVRPSCTVFGVSTALEKWLTGYRIEHLQLGLQMAVCFVLAVLPIIVQKMFKTLDHGGSVLYTAITVAVVLEPSTGDSFRKAAMRASGAGLAGGMGMLVLLCAGKPDTTGDTPCEVAEDYNHSANEIGGWVAGALALLGFILMTNHQRYWRHREFWGTAIFTLPIVTVPAIRCSSNMTQCFFYQGAAYRMVNVLLGIGIASVVSFVVLPVRARGLLQKQMARTLTKIGDLSVWLVGQVCVLPQSSGPLGRACLPGATGTDGDSLYTDDGLRARLAPLMATAAELNADLAYMGKLLEAARTEFYLLRRPHSFPTQQYRNLLQACHVTMGVFLNLLDSLESGGISLEVCQRHIGDLSEAGVRLSAAFTALSSLIRPPKVKKAKKGKKKAQARGKQEGQKGDEVRQLGMGKQQGGQQQQQQQQGQSAGARQQTAGVLHTAGPSVAAAVAAVAAAEAAIAAHGAAGAGAGTDAAAAGEWPARGAGSAQAPPPPPVPQWQQQASLHADVEAQSGDDPFAGLDSDWEGQADPKFDALTDSELFTAQQMARHLSRVMSLSQRSSTARPARGHLQLEVPTESSKEGRPSEPALPLSTGAAAAAAAPAAKANGAGSGSSDGVPGGYAAGELPAPQPQQEQQGGTSLGSIVPKSGGAEERREWAQGKLMALVDSIRQLEANAYKERQRDPNAAGLPAFMLVVHACINTTRQCGTCFTALDPERGAELHAYFNAARKTHRLEQPVAL